MSGAPVGLVVDNFAGGGGASTGIEAALGRAVDIAINHDAEAIAMHEANHPGTRHIRNNVWSVDPVEVTGGKPVELAGMPLADLSCWEPACGEGHMARPLGEYFREVIASDVHRYSDDHEIFDFTMAKFERRPGHGRPDFVVTNPPFRLASEFIAAADAVAKVGYAMLVRIAFLEGKERFATLFSQNPPTLVCQFVERVAMVEGRLDEGASSATAYCWLVWLRNSEPTTYLRWIPPSRSRLERPDDYPDYPVETLPPPADGLFGDGAQA